MFKTCVDSQHDQRVELLAGQDNILAGHCPLTGHYFEPLVGGKFPRNLK